MTEFKIKFRYLKRFLVNQGQALWCGVAGHRWVTGPTRAYCSRCQKPGW